MGGSDYNRGEMQEKLVFQLVRGWSRWFIIVPHTCPGAQHNRLRQPIDPKALALCLATKRGSKSLSPERAFVLVGWQGGTHRQ